MQSIEFSTQNQLPKSSLRLGKLSHDQLLRDTKKWAREEQSALASLLPHIKEVERRRLFAALKYQSINQYVEKELGYSADEAWRRVCAARLLAEIPEIEEKLTTGELNLTSIGMAQALFQKEKRQAKAPFSAEKKKEVLLEIAGKSTRDVARTLTTHSTLPQPSIREQVRVINDELSEYNFAADKETQLDIERLTGLLAHSNPGMTLGQLIKKLCKIGLKELDPAAKTAAPRKSDRERVAKKLASKAEDLKLLWKRGASRCTNCGSYFALQKDHIHPKAKGGNDSPENLRLLCRNCNQRAAIEHFGQTKMNMFFKSPVVEYERLCGPS